MVKITVLFGIHVTNTLIVNRTVFNSMGLYRFNIGLFPLLTRFLQAIKENLFVHTEAPTKIYIAEHIILWLKAFIFFS